MQTDLEALYDQMEAILAWPDERLFGKVAGVSGWSPAQHLEHLARANGRTFKGLRLLAEGKVPAERGSANLLGVLVLTLGRLPRGRAKSPEFAVPPDVLTREELTRSLGRNRKALSDLAPYLPALSRLDGRMRHQRLGMLTARQWLRFVRLHTRHHLRIIRDVASRL